MNDAPPDTASEPRDSADVVLVVDDVPDNIALLNDALDEAGYTVLVATSGESALALAARAWCRWAATRASTSRGRIGLVT